MADLIKKHPEYLLNSDDWLKWRLTYRGGKDFLEQYLKRFSAREDITDFADRKAITYVPAFAKAAVNEIRNSIFQRMIDVTRSAGSATYQSAIAGTKGGVDLHGNTMTSFIGTKVLGELLSMSKIGVFVDMPTVGENPTRAATKGKRPYLYTYTIESIFNWTTDPETGLLDSILLRDCDDGIDPITGFPFLMSTNWRYRWLRLVDDKVIVQFIDSKGEKSGESVVLNISRIPFVCLDIPESLLIDVADYQIGEMNLASSDMNFAFRGNFPIYTEQRDARVDSPHLQRGPVTPTKSTENGDRTTEPVAGTAAAAGASKSNELKLGVGRGRAYPLGADRPDFIAPPSEPLKASMDKQEQMKREIRQLVHLSVTNLSAKMASADSKGYDERGLEAGLSAIGLVLERAEREIAEIWSAYEGDATAATVYYPTSYNLKSDAERIEEAKRYTELVIAAPSQKFQKEMFKCVVKSLLAHKVPGSTLNAIYKEIDAAETIVMKPEELMKAVEGGVLSAETCAKIMGFPSDEAQKAKKEHAERLARIAEAQAIASPETHTAGGTPPKVGEPAAAGGKAARDEKRASKDKTGSGDLKNKQRGDGKSTGGES